MRRSTKLYTTWFQADVSMDKGKSYLEGPKFVGFGVLRPYGVSRAYLNRFECRLAMIPISISHVPQHLGEVQTTTEAKNCNSMGPGDFKPCGYGTLWLKNSKSV